MKRNGILCFLISLLLPWSPVAGQTNHVDSTLRVVRSLYESGQYGAAEMEARRLLDREVLSDSVRGEAELHIAFSLIAQGRTSGGKGHFLNLLKLRPDFTLDPVLTSPKILAVFSDAQETFRKNSSPPEAERAVPSRVAGGISYRALLFPGWEQLHTGRTTAGYVFGGAAIASLGAGVMFELLRSSAREDYLAATVPNEISRKYDRYNRFYKSEIYAFTAFGLVYILSEIDAVWHAESTGIEPSVQVSERSTWLYGVRVRL